MDRTQMIVGCCTVVLDRPMLARFSLLQVAAQTVRPHFNVIVATGAELDRRFIDDLIDDTTIVRSVRQPITTVAAYSLGLEELRARGVNLFLCLDHDCLYKRDYVEAVCGFVRSTGLTPNDGLFCLNLVDQQWITLHDDGRAELRAHGFRNGLGLSAEEAQETIVGAPPTFVFGLGAAEVVLERHLQGRDVPTGYHDMFWRRALLDAGIQITQVSTPRPVFAYVRHRNNLCWGDDPLRAPVANTANQGRAGSDGWAVSVSTSRNGRGPVDVSVVIPTYNEGDWLQRTIQSIRGVKTDLGYEIVVVDDGCTDGSTEGLTGGEGVRRVETGAEQLGLVVAKNIGARAAAGRYVCFIDSHVLVHDHWLDSLRETCDAYPGGALVSGHLPDTVLLSASGQWDHNQYGYIIRNCLLGTGWHHYGRDYTDRPYLQPLTPGGLMFTRKRHFARLGGFDPLLRKWGAEDIQISLHNYYLGGENVVDPRVVVFHFYKNSTTKKRTFSVTNTQHAFNCLRVAAMYFPYDYYEKVRNALVQRGGANGVVAEIESEAHLKDLERTQAAFVRGFDTWVVQFATELRKFLADAQPQTAAPAVQGRDVILAVPAAYP